MDTAKSTIISHLYEHMDENDWLDGLDIYQAGHVSNLKAIESLITSKVASSSERSPSEVRIKIHPTGGSIQWIECTCRKNRVAGRYCEHIGATMIHIDREKPKVFENLDPKMPLKPPPSPVRRKPQDPTIPKSEKKANATEAVLTHLEGNIQNVALLANGPQLRVRVEIKPGHISSYNLELDEAAKFLQDHLHLSCLSPEVKKLKLYDLQLKLGTRIAPIGNSGEVVTERVVAFINPDYEKSKKSKKNSVFKSDSLTTADQYLQKIGGNSSDVYAQFLPSKNMARHMGKNWIYVEDLGYFSYDSKSVKPSWNDLPTNKIWQDDEAAWLCKRNFSEYADLGPIWLSPELELNPVVVGAEFSKVNVLGSGGVDWFSIKPEYTVGNSKISMVDILLEYRRKKREFLRAGNRWIQVPDLVKQFAWDVDEESKSIRVDKLGMIRFKAAMGELDQFAGSRKILDKIREQTEFSVEKPAPEIVNSKLNLRGYQQEGYQWMWWLFTNGLSGLLADEMGLGKTHQSMAVMTAISQNVKNAKFLVICPTTVLDHWLDKIEAFTPGINPIKYHGIKRNHLLADIDRRCITVLSSYGIVMRDIETMASITWDAVILDEAHFVKNIDTATYRAVCKLKSKSRYCLSGTPMENHLGELKAVYDFLLPGYLGSNEYFKLQYLNPIASGDGEESIGALQKLIHPFKMRRTKANVLKDLPEKVEDLRHCMLSDDQAAMYQQTLDLKAKPLLNIVQDENQSIPYLHIFSVITILKQIADHPALLTNKDDWKKYQSGKFELFKELVSEALDSGHKIVIYSQYLDMLSIITQYLTEEKITHELLTGATRNRGEVIARFQNNPEVKVFCASLLAGGIGIDLTAANVVIHYDRWWNASKENQATDRVHRIGQNRNVQVLKLVTRNTLEEKIDALINKKKELFEKFLDRDEEMFKSLTRSEIVELLQ